MQINKQHFLTAMDIQAWQLKKTNLYTTMAYCTTQKIELMIIGESLSLHENSLFNAMLNTIDLACRPDPLPFLEKQIALISPKLLLAVGRIAAHYLLNTNIPLPELRGQVHRYGLLNTPLIVTYHPAYLLHNPLDKRKALQDLQLIFRTLTA